MKLKQYLNEPTKKIHIQNKFSIDFDITKNPNFYYKLRTNLEQNGTFIKTLLGSKYFFSSTLDIDEVIKLIQGTEEYQKDDPYIITDHTNHIIKYLGNISNAAKKFIEDIVKQ